MRWYVLNALTFWDIVHLVRRDFQPTLSLFETVTWCKRPHLRRRGGRFFKFSDWLNIYSKLTQWGGGGGGGGGKFIQGRTPWTRRTPSATALPRCRRLVPPCCVHEEEEEDENSWPWADQRPIHTDAFMHACMHTYMVIDVYMHACMHACMGINVCMHACMHTYMVIDVCVHACIHTYMRCLCACMVCGTVCKQWSRYLVCGKICKQILISQYVRKYLHACTCMCD